MLMARFILLRSVLAVIALAAALLAAAESARAQGWEDDRFFMMRDPFRRNTPFFGFPAAPPRPSESPLPPGPIVETIDQPGVVYGSTAEADRARSSLATEYLLVVGDTLADQLAQGLADAFVTDRPEVAVIKKTKASSGLVRADFYDWPAQVPGLLAAEKPTAIAMMLGTNDRQVLRDETGPHEPRSSRWRELYGNRVEAMVNRLKEKGVPVFVVGQPSMRNPRLSDDMKYINEILRERAGKAGAFYVEVWDGFVDEKGEFMVSGPALDGQTRRLRIADGVHFTRAGGRKLAHYVERDLVRLFDQRAGRAPLLPREGPEMTPGGRPVAGPVLPLTQPAGPVGALAGAEQRPAEPAVGLAAQVLVEGMPVASVAGRADDFRWPPDSRTAVGPGPSVSLPAQPQGQPGAAVPAPPVSESQAKPAVPAKQDTQPTKAKTGAPATVPGRTAAPDATRPR